MDISSTDNGGRRSNGDRRLEALDTFRVEKRSTPDRRINTTDKRGKFFFMSNHPERRAIDLFFRERFKFTK